MCNRTVWMLTLLSISGFGALNAQEDAAVTELRELVGEMQERYEKRIEALESEVKSLKQEQQEWQAAKAAEPSGGASEQAVPAAEQRPLTDEEKAVMVHSRMIDPTGEMPDREIMFVPTGRQQYWKGFSFNGYLRAGAGFNEHGAAQEEFVIPDGLFEIGWRLGNEKDTYGELSLNQELIDDPQAIQASVHFRPAFKFNGSKLNYLPTGNSSGSDPQFLVREAYVLTSNVLDNEDITFWAGQRFYDRHDIHINDFYFLDMSGFGGGVEKIPLGNGTLAVAYLAGTYDELVAVDSGKFQENNLDVRWKDVELLGGKNLFWVNSAFNSESDAPNPQDSEFGMAFGWLHEHMIGEAWTKTGIQWGYGPAADFNTYSNNWKPQGAIGDQESLLITHQMVWDVDEDFSFMFVALYQYDDLGFVPDDNGAPGADTRSLASAGIRPIWWFTDTLALQSELGIDWVDDNRFSAGKDGGTLTKFTIAPTIKPQGGFWTRPEIRLYATYAFWDDSFEGQIGGDGQANDTSGFSFGVQTEVWW